MAVYNLCQIRPLSFVAYFDNKSWIEADDNILKASYTMDELSFLLG